MTYFTKRFHKLWPHSRIRVPTIKHAARHAKTQEQKAFCLVCGYQAVRSFYVAETTGERLFLEHPPKKQSFTQMRAAIEALFPENRRKARELHTKKSRRIRKVQSA